jgi:hypothetical protein
MPLLRSYFRLCPCLIALCFLLFMSGCKEDEPKVEKNEGIYINEVYASSGEDWFELYNSNEETKDLAGYVVYDDGSARWTLPAGTSIAAKQYLVIFCDDLATGLHTNFKLASTGESISIENKDGQIIDHVTYPILADGQVYGRFPDGSANLGISGVATQGTSNGSTQSSLIQNVTREPLVPGLTQSVTISADVLSNSGIPTVVLHYRIDGGPFTEIAMAGNQTYNATIPALNHTGVIEYYISATSSGNTSLYPFDAPEQLEKYILNDDVLPLLRINEFMAVNTACCTDNAGAEPEYDDWIEIYNGGLVAIDLAGMYLSDDTENPFKYKIADTDAVLTTIQPGGFLIVWADEEGSQGPLHANFQLAGDGEDVALFYIDGRTIHSYSYGAQQENKSVGLNPDGSSDFETLTSPSPGESNN